jgi:geranylgeranyl pyrophosphate synthase
MADSARLLRAAVYWQAAQLGSAGIDDHVRGAACVELAHLGYLAFANVRCGPAPAEPAPLAVDDLRTSARGRDRGGSCADAFAVMAGDFLLAKAYVLAARLGSSVCRLLAVASKEVCSREATTCMEAWTGVRSVDSERRFTGKDSRATFHVLACRVACEIADVPGELRVTMSDYAALFGAALSAARTTDRTPHLEAAQAVAAGIPDLDVRAEMMAAVRWLATRGADS